jgi:DNA repair exonuclease SbcCD ATPase subunit
MPASTELLARVTAARRLIDRQVGEATAMATRGISVTQEIAQLTESQRLYGQVGALLTSIGEGLQNEAQRQIEGLVTRGLQTIFGDDLSFHIVQEVKANAAQVDFVIRSKAEGAEVETPVMESRGGGLAAVVGFLVRLVVLLLSKDRQESIMFLDETFGHVSVEYEPRLAEFIREIVDNTGVQIVLVTHSTAFNDAADKRYHFALQDGVTKVREGAGA